MALVSKGHWSEEIYEVTESEEYQTCEILIIDPSKVIVGDRDWSTGERSEDISQAKVYEGRARFIPVRASVYEGGEGQANAMFIRAGRIQLPHSEVPLRLSTNFQITFTKADRNPALLSRTARVSDDFLGSTTGTRTFHVMLDADTKV